MNVYYDDPRYSYEDYWQGREYESKVDKMVLKQMLDLIEDKDKKKVVEIGAGFGRLVEVYQKLFPKILLIDPSWKLLSLAQLKFKDHPGLECRKGSLEKIPCRKATVDVVLLIRVIHHIEDLSLAFAQINRVLKKGGYLVLEYPNKVHLLSRLRAFFKRDFAYFKSEGAEDKRSFKNVISGSIPFKNYHPKAMAREFKKAGFEIKKVISASYFRRDYIKKLFPGVVLSTGEKVLQAFLSGFWLGPSNFVLAKKIRTV
jgi:ubiquinone/menaquinone biosynthesis C-methylase UbiE